MKAWAAKATGRGRESFCEQCGAAGRVRDERQVADRPRSGELLVCRGCSLLTCTGCWPGPFLACRACRVPQDPVLVAVASEAPAREVAAVAQTVPAAPAGRTRRPRRGRPGVLAAAAVLALAVVGGAVALTRPGSGNGGVAGLTARSTPAATSSDAAVRSAETPTATPAGTADNSGEPSPSRTATPRPGTPADLQVTSSVIRRWVDPLGELRAQVLVGVTNRGGSPGYLPSAASAWEVRAPDGFVVSRGRFAHVFPRVVEPGATAWMVDALSAAFTEPGDLDELGVMLDMRNATPADAAELDALTVTDVEWQLDEAGSVAVSGLVENTGASTIERWSAGVVLVATDGSPLAAAYEIGEVEGLAPGQRAQFSTSYPGSGPVAEDEVASVVAVAVPLD